MYNLETANEIYTVSEIQIVKWLSVHYSKLTKVYLLLK